MEFKLKEATLKLLPEKAIFWESESLMIIADAHIGKVSHFRKNGIPVPRMAERNNLWRLSGLLLKYEPRTVVFLGDLFHSKLNKAWEEFIDFRRGHDMVDMILVKGNHDILSNRAFTAADLEPVEEMQTGPFLLTHDRVESEKYNLHGHIHPCVKLRGAGRQRVKVPCFYFSANFGVLPSFGDFTGSHPIRLQEGDQVYVPVDDQVILMESA